MLVEPGTIVDTTTDSRWTPVRVTAHLAEPIINLDGHACHLDGPAAFAAYLAYTDRHGHHSLPPMGRDSVVDFALPLATWTAPAPGPVHQLARAATPGHVWGWACSAAAADPAAWTVVEVRRKPNSEAMHRYAPDRKVHLATGPLKARNAPHPATIVRTITWWALADPDRLHALLSRVPGLGRHTRHGNGRVHRWEVTPDPRAATLWRRRVWPDPDGTPDTIRAPYHHHTRLMPCTPPPQRSEERC